MINARQILDPRFWREIRLYQPTIAHIETQIRPRARNTVGEIIPEWEIKPGLERVRCTFAPAGTFRDKEMRTADSTRISRSRLVLLDGVYTNIQLPDRLVLEPPGHPGDPFLVWNIAAVETDAVGVVTRLGVEYVGYGQVK